MSSLKLTAWVSVTLSLFVNAASAAPSTPLISVMGSCKADGILARKLASLREQGKTKHEALTELKVSSEGADNFAEVLWTNADFGRMSPHESEIYFSDKCRRVNSAKVNDIKNKEEKIVPPEAICEMRAALMGSVAQERDNGQTREQVKRKTPEKFKSFLPWIDLVYDKMQGMKPQEVANLVRYSCLKNER